MKKLVSIFLVVLLILSFSITYADQQTGNESISSGQQTENPSPPTNPKWDPSQVNIIEIQPHEVIDSPDNTPMDPNPPIIVNDPETNTSAKSQSGIRVLVNGTKVTFPDVQPYIKNNLTLVPIRFVVEQLEAKVGWDQKTKEVTIEKDGKKIVLQIGNKTVTVNGSKITLDTSVELKGDRTMVPLRFISEAFGANVGWDGTNRVVTITMK